MHLIFPSFCCQCSAAKCILVWLRILGVKIHERVQVEKVLTDGQKVQGVKTDRGDIKCDVFVNCAGQVSFVCSTFLIVLLFLFD